MKQTRFLLLAVLCLLAASVAKADDTPIPVGQLPAAAKTFVQANFPTKKIIYAEKDWNSYECRLNDGTKRVQQERRVEEGRLPGHDGGACRYRPCCHAAVCQCKLPGMRDYQNRQGTLRLRGRAV